MTSFVAFVAFSMTFLLSMFFRTFFAVVGPEMARELSLTPVQFGVLSSAFFGSFALLQVPVGILFDRYGCRRPMAVLMTVGAGGALLMALGTSFEAALLGHALLGAGCAPALMGVYFHYGQTHPWEKAARIAATVAAIGSLGALLSATPLATMSAAFGWRHSVLASAGLLMLAALAIFLSVQTPSEIRPNQDGKETGGGATDVFFLLLLAPIFASASLGTVFRSAWAAPYLTTIVGLSSHDASNVFVLISVAASITGFALPLAMRLWSPGSIVLAMYITAVVLLAFLAISPASGAVFATVVLSALYAVGNCHTIAMAEAQGRVGARGRGLIMGILNSLGFLGVATFSPVFGIMARNLTGAAAYVAMFATASVVLMISLTAYMFRDRVQNLFGEAAGAKQLAADRASRDPIR